MQDKYTVLLIGRFQPFHIGHLSGLWKILENYNVSDIKVIAVRRENSRLNDNPIPLNVTIDNILKGLKKIYGEKYNIEVYGICYKNLIDLFIKIGNILDNNKYNRDYVTITSDIKRLIMFKIAGIFYEIIYGIDFKVVYSHRIISGREIRENLRDGNMEYIKYIVYPEDEMINYIIHPPKKSNSL
jgi:hypothetical protein